MPRMRARPLCGNKAFSKSADSGLRFSTVLMARAKARASPERRRSIQGLRSGCKLFSVKHSGGDGKQTDVTPDPANRLLGTRRHRREILVEMT